MKERFGPGEIGLFIFDADANVRRDIDCYGDRFADGCWMVIDDYISATDKAGPTRAQVDELTAEGRLLPLGILRLGNLDRPVARPVKIFLGAQTKRPEGVTPDPSAGVFDIEADNGMLKGVKYVPASFDQRRLTFFRS